MVTRTSDDWHGCPIRYGAVVFGDVWSLLILRDIVFKGARHYADFLNADEGISTNILAARLARLEAEGVLSKTQDVENKTRYVYGLTEKGKALVPTLLEIMDWSERWDPQTEVPEEFINELRQDRAALATKITSDL
jgi:DNA-binding HxlR family transcriptional regulator